jgi:hypothetical protein
VGGSGSSAGDRRDIDTTVAHSARVHDYWLGGTNNFAADRAAGDAVVAAPGTILERAARTLDFSRPVAVMLIAVMHLIGDQDEPYRIMRELMEAVPAGSYLALSQVASDIEAAQMAEAARRYNRLARETQRHRSHAEVARFFDGLDLVEPGLVPVQQWRPASEEEASARSAMWGGVARKP